MSSPETDELFHVRLLRVVTDSERYLVMIVYGASLDTLGRKYNRYRTGVALKGL